MCPTRTSLGLSSERARTGRTPMPWCGSTAKLSQLVSEWGGPARAGPPNVGGRPPPSAVGGGRSAVAQRSIPRSDRRAPDPKPTRAEIGSQPQTPWSEDSATNAPVAGSPPVGVRPGLDRNSVPPARRLGDGLREPVPGVPPYRLDPLPGDVE